MKKNLKKISIILLLFGAILINTTCFASTDEVRLFLSEDFANSNSARETISLAVGTFQNLGYNNVLGVNRYTTTNSRNIVLDYINGAGNENHYAFFEFAHGADGRFNMCKNGSIAPQRIYSSDISGNWHLVFLNSCEIMTTDSMARAFKTVGYSNRATLGWYKIVEVEACQQWWSYFYHLAGTTNLRSACLSAADQCSSSTPIRIFGDKDWNGKAW